MPIDVEELEVIHNEAESRFEIWINQVLSKLDYMYNGNTLTITHVGVAPGLRGQGVAGRLTQAALDYAEEKSLRVIPMCPYAAAYIRRHPKYKKLING